jgi:hypothetical protein
MPPDIKYPVDGISILQLTVNSGGGGSGGGGGGVGGWKKGPTVSLWTQTKRPPGTQYMEH